MQHVKKYGENICDSSFLLCRVVLSYNEKLHYIGQNNYPLEFIAPEDEHEKGYTNIKEKKT